MMNSLSLGRSVTIMSSRLVKSPLSPWTTAKIVFRGSETIGGGGPRRTAVIVVGGRMPLRRSSGRRRCIITGSARVAGGGTGTRRPSSLFGSMASHRAAATLSTRGVHVGGGAGGGFGGDNGTDRNNYYSAFSPCGDGPPRGRSFESSTSNRAFTTISRGRRDPIGGPGTGIGRALSWPSSSLRLPTMSHTPPRQQQQRRSILHLLPESLSKKSSLAPVDFPASHRWTAVLPANMVHLSIGAVYCYAMWTPTLTTLSGVVTSAPADWTHSDVLPVFSVAAVTLGVTTSVLGSWVERVGPRTSGAVGSVAWGVGLGLSALATSASTSPGEVGHSLPMLYAGYGIFGGIGWGLMYLTPVSACMRWFPDRRGFATGLALSAFGLGAAVAPPVIQAALDYFFVSPDFLGGVDQVVLHTLDDGSQVVADSSEVGIPGTHVVVATEGDIASMGESPTSPMLPGVYALNTGDTGTSSAFASLGLLYGSTGLVASRFMRLPHPDWRPDGWDADADADTTTATTADASIGVPADVAVRTAQFPLLWLSVFGNACGGLALLSSSKLMITDIWAGALPAVVTSSFATGYVAALGGANALGRFGWAYASDRLGRRNTYALFALGAPIVGGAPLLCHHAVSSAGGGSTVILPLAAFCGGSVLAITFYGGIFSVLPAYIADLWGQKHSGAIHGKALTAWAAAAVGGPMGLSYLRSHAVDSAVTDLLSVVDDGVFERTFDCHIDNAQTLVDAKTVTIRRLVEIAPEGTVDPTPFLYDGTCYVAAGLIGVSALANFCIRPVDVSLLLKLQEGGGKGERERGGDLEDPDGVDGGGGEAGKR